MLAWLSWPQILASSMNISMKSESSASEGRMRLMARIFSKPSTPKDLALKTSAIPPTEMRSSSTYFPNGIGWRTRWDMPPRRSPDCPLDEHSAALRIVEHRFQCLQAKSWAPNPGGEAAHTESRNRV